MQIPDFVSPNDVFSYPICRHDETIPLSVETVFPDSIVAGGQIFMKQSSSGTLRIITPEILFNGMSEAVDFSMKIFERVTQFCVFHSSSTSHVVHRGEIIRCTSYMNVFVGFLYNSTIDFRDALCHVMKNQSPWAIYEQVL